MQVGIGLPSTIPGTRGVLIVDWARRADAGRFSSLGVLDRVVYANYEPLITLAAAAAVTSRARLMTTVLLATVRDTALFGKQAASVDALSGGRLTLGLGIGGRPDDFAATGKDLHTRGRRFEEQLTTLRRIWSGERLSEDVGTIGPAPAQAGGPEVLIGGYAPPAIQRAARWGAGYIAGGAPPQAAKQAFDMVRAGWQEAGRSGTPRLVGASYFGLGENAREKGGAYIGDYYSFMGSRADAMASSFPADGETVRATIQAFTDIGADELMLWPTIPELDQVDRLADLLG